MNFTIFRRGSLLVILFFLFCLSLPSYGAEQYEIYIAQGIEKLNEGKYKEALDLLLKALKEAPDNREARFYTGVAYSRLGRYRDAERLLLEVLGKDRTSPEVNFELGRLRYAMGDCRGTERYMKQFMTYSDDEAMKSYADSLIKECYESEKAQEEKPYRVNVSGGVQYDSNVVLEPTNPIITADRKRDGRGVFLVNAGARLYENRFLKFTADYNFYQSLHFELNDYNVHYHRVSPAVEFNVHERVVPAIGYALEYILFGGDTYGAIHTYFANLRINETKIASTEVIYEYRDTKYWDTEVFESNSIRTGYKSTFGIKQNYEMDRLRWQILYYYNDKRAERDYWSYRGNRVGIKGSYKITEPLRVRGGVEYERREHRGSNPNTASADERVDRMQKYSVKLTYTINERMAVTFSESYTRNDSNLREFDYERNMVGVILTVGII